MTAEEEFEAARLRIQQNKPKRIPKDTKISLDAVALEAGRTKGSIRKSRYPALYDRIMADIENCTETPLEECKRVKKKYKKDSEGYQQRLAEAYGEILMLTKRLEELEEKLKD